MKTDTYVMNRMSIHLLHLQSANFRYATGEEKIAAYDAYQRLEVVLSLSVWKKITCEGHETVLHRS